MLLHLLCVARSCIFSSFCCGAWPVTVPLPFRFSSHFPPYHTTKESNYPQRSLTSSMRSCLCIQLQYRFTEGFSPIHLLFDPGGLLQREVSLFVFPEPAAVLIGSPPVVPHGCLELARTGNQTPQVVIFGNCNIKTAAYPTTVLQAVLCSVEEHTMESRLYAKFPKTDARIGPRVCKENCGTDTTQGWKEKSTFFARSRNSSCSCSG